ncbi:alkaline phosphatase [Adhaeribacter pallidiroseus]|uniref:Alkaline phosphatase n=1 Tax=Adhaeribacter pallidiroseus TaxID=2072847 RepID=A0A369QAY6_9BACT|nr:alkaline phosphatase [Adhaeribacter pallidiroseus]RDC61864.1 Alkaline phosphatase [Adhaeribacter pallidiroseus]
MKKKLLLVSLLLLSGGGVFAQKNAKNAGTDSRNVIIYIGDGFGIAPKTATRMALGQGREGQRFTSDPNFKKLALDNLKYSATVTTHSLNSWITDSAPGASVYAAGKSGKQDNEVISLDPSSGESIETILESAKKQGYAVGLVSTARITHATPAAFASHIWYRDLESYIAAQYLASSQDEYKAIFNASPTEAYRYNASRDWILPEPKVGVELDVILGGGSRFFMPAKVNSPYATVVDAQGNPIKDPKTGTDVTLGSGRRADDVDLVDFAKKQKKYAYVNSRDALMKLDMSQFSSGSENKLLGLFNNSHMNYEQDRQTSAPWEPSLADMTETAIKVLKAKGGAKGFFLIVEAGRIDHLEHANTGGISVVAGAGGNQYQVDADKPTYEGGGEANYTATPSTARTANVYASDYMIKEVLAFDYAVAEGRSFMNVPVNGKTLLFTTSDHECGGFAVTGLHDEADAQGNATKIRTYAGQIKKSNALEASYATPTNLVRGDGGDEGWFPEYTLKMFQNKYYPEPSSPTGRRIVVAYGSNPLTNGNSTKAGGTPGNHTPQDIWVGAEDNTGSHAVQITGRGLLDNTALTPIMADFLKLSAFKNNLGKPAYRKATDAVGINVSPVPVANQSSISFEVKNPSQVSVELFDLSGTKIKTVAGAQKYTTGQHSLPINGSELKAGMYVVVVNIDGVIQSKKIIKVQ